MYLKAKNFIEDLTGFTIYRANTPWGFNLYKDIERIIPEWSPKIIFDVGANVGQTAVAFAKAWPSAKIFSFEPVKDTFSTLKKETENIPNIKAVHLALGSIVGEASIRLFPDSQLASLDHRFSNDSSNRLETVQVLTIDHFCIEKAINYIDLLKIDTEGHDLEVLNGAIALLEEERINFMLVEFSITDTPGKVTISDISVFLRKYNFVCLGIYDQFFWCQSQLYYGNALFCRRNIFS